MTLQANGRWLLLEKAGERYTYKTGMNRNFQDKFAFLHETTYMNHLEGAVAWREVTEARGAENTDDDWCRAHTVTLGPRRPLPVVLKRSMPETNDRVY